VSLDPVSGAPTILAGNVGAKQPVIEGYPATKRQRLIASIVRRRIGIREIGRPEKEV
jgi:hypothetical protein